MTRHDFAAFAPCEPLSLDGKGILVTGGTGSFGHAITRAIADKYKPSRLVIFSRDEMKQYEMAQVFDDQRYPFMRYFIGDVRDLGRLEMAMRGIDVVIHAAALKHVPIAEYNPFECIHTNVIGAENVVRAALTANVSKVIALSTDKAANPINLYGASKLASDKIFVAANSLAGRTGVRFSVVRYGNVLGSRGSVVPFFRKLLADGAAELPITSPKMTRFSITLDQGVDFVLSCLAMMGGGEVFVPKIPSMRITDLAQAMAPQAATRIIGIRPGEKLHEVMITGDDSRNTIDLGDRYAVLPSFGPESGTSLRSLARANVADDFSYASDTNDDWLSVEEIRSFLELS